MARIELEHASKGLGLGNRKVSQTAKGLHGMAAAAYPFLGKLDAQTFTRLLGAGELTLGASLLLPIVPTALAGIGLAGFSAGLLGLYLRIPGMRQNGSLRPTAQGTPLAKDAWLLGIGLSFAPESSDNAGQHFRCSARSSAATSGGHFRCPASSPFHKIIDWDATAGQFAYDPTYDQKQPDWT